LLEFFEAVEPFSFGFLFGDVAEALAPFSGYFDVGGCASKPLVCDWVDAAGGEFAAAGPAGLCLSLL
jgi:hypothetical protein